MNHVLIINNERDAVDLGWIPYLERALKEAGANHISVLHHGLLNDQSFADINPTHTVMYGRVTHHWDMEEIRSSYACELEFLRTTTKPVLGICAGHQLMGIAHGSGMGKVVECDDIDIVESGFIRIFGEPDCELFTGLQTPFFCNCMHRDEVSQIPEGFERVAFGDVCGIQAMRKTGLPVFGIQFHPEWANERFPAGQTIFTNFLKI